MQPELEPHHLHATTILPVADMGDAVAFYGRLGFAVDAFDAGYALVSHGGHEILHLRLVPDLDPARNAASVYFHVADADEWHAALAQASTVFGDVADRPWGMREFSITDPSGNLIRVGHHLVNTDG